MKKQALFAVIGLIAALAVRAYPQVVSDQLKVTIPYAFTAGGKELPAGNYSIERSGITNSFLVLRGEDKKTTVSLDVLTRIEARWSAENDPRIVLDKEAGNHYTLSEVFFPQEDGYLLIGVKKTPHTHETIKVKKG